MTIELLLTLAGLVIGLLSIAGIQLKFSRAISWRQVRRACLDLLPKVTEFDPDLVIGINDGGVIAGILSTNHRASRRRGAHFLPFIALGMAVKREANGAKKLSLVGKELVGDLSGKRVLLVDNHLYTGASMRLANAFVETRNPSAIKTLVLFNHEMKQKLFQPDLVAHGIGANRRRVPWSISQNHYSVYET